MRGQLGQNRNVQQYEQEEHRYLEAHVGKYGISEHVDEDHDEQVVV